MNLIFRDQPHAQLLALGVSRVVAFDSRVEPGTRVVIGATEEEPRKGWIKAGEKWEYLPGRDEDGWSMLSVYANYPMVALPLPLGMVVGTAVVAEALPIVGPVAGLGPQQNALTFTEHDGARILVRYEYEDVLDLGMQVHHYTAELAFDPDGFVPGRWALMLDDAKPVSARCPRCWGDGDGGIVPGHHPGCWGNCHKWGCPVPEPSQCVLCSGSGVVDDPGASGLALNEWSST